MNKKAHAFNKFLQDRSITCFEIEEVDKDELNTVVFRSHIAIEGQQLPTIIILDDSIYGIVRILIAPSVLQTDNSNRLFKEINKVNKQYKAFKYYIDDSDNLCLDSCILCEDGKLSGDLVYTLLNVIIKHLEKEYKKIMRILWAE